MSSRRVVYAALIGNILVAVTKTVAAILSGSSAMVSEAVHSFVDSANEILLLYGIHRSKRPAHLEHPLGHGRELYFWSFVVALLIFALGAGVSIYEGILHLQHPEPIARPNINYIVLGLAAVFEGWSWLIALKAFNKMKGSRGVIEAIEESKDPPAFIVLFEDSAALLGIAIAAAATFLSQKFGFVLADGIASILIGLILGAMATALATESKSLLIGEQATPELRRDIARIARESSKVTDLRLVFAVHLAPEEIVVALSLRFPDDLRSPEIAAQIHGIEDSIRKVHPEVVAVFVRPDFRS
jgi:cation diffusion facilitator family transporter